MQETRFDRALRNYSARPVLFPVPSRPTIPTGTTGLHFPPSACDYCERKLGGGLPFNDARSPIRTIRRVHLDRRAAPFFFSFSQAIMRSPEKERHPKAKEEGGEQRSGTTRTRCDDDYYRVNERAVIGCGKLATRLTNHRSFAALTEPKQWSLNIT